VNDLLITNQVRTATETKTNDFSALGICVLYWKASLGQKAVSKIVISFVPQQAHSSEVILTGHKARTPATLGIPRKPASQLTGFSFFFSRSKRFSNLR
jgi:hypothetical protein